MTSISNDILSISVAFKGAELQSLYHKQQKIEYMWSGDPAYWGKKSPVLFPIVGELKKNTYSYKGENYKLSRHGFAREIDFELTEHTEDSLTFSIKETEQTLAVYPFKFLFSVRYTLIENTVQITYIVENTGEGIMYFSVGGHPAFKVPFVEGTKYDDYELVFNEKETTGRYPLSSEGLIMTEPVPLLENESVLPLKKELFSADAIVLKGIKSTSISIESKKTDKRIEVGFEDFPYVGIWETKGGDFVCIEPWCGIADSVNASGRLEDKEGINSLQPSDVFIASFTIQVT
jgi:galactose mutarotase-like enzyme